MFVSIQILDKQLKNDIVWILMKPIKIHIKVLKLIMYNFFSTLSV